MVVTGIARVPNWQEATAGYVTAERGIPASQRPDSVAYLQLPLGLASEFILYGVVRNNWDLGHSERTMNAKKIAVVGLLVAVVALAACRREECCKPMKLGAGDVAAQQR